LCLRGYGEGGYAKGRGYGWGKQER
jgi:hypothetical protein